VRDLAQDAGVLVRQEVELAKAELREKVEVVRDDLESRRAVVQEDLARDVQAARREAAQSGKELGVAGGMMAGAAVFGLVALGVLAALVARLLDYAMPLAAALAVTLALYVVAAAALALVGRQRLARATPLVSPSTVDGIRADVARVTGAGRLREVMPPVPEQTIETVKEDIEWAKHPTRSAAR
jgi:hypothetical protein